MHYTRPFAFLIWSNLSYESFLNRKNGWKNNFKIDFGVVHVTFGKVHNHNLKFKYLICMFKWNLFFCKFQ